MQAHADKWWHSLEDDDPITLEPLADLPSPPFELFPNLPSSGVDSDLGGRRHLFDGQVLAEYIISQGRFENPYNRAPLTREDCVRLDEHCKNTSRAEDSLHRDVCVTAAYDLQQSMRLHKTDGSESATQLALSLRREAATALLHLFQFRRTARQPTRRSCRNRQRELREPDTSAAAASLTGGWAPGEEPHPGLVIIDDNEDGDFDLEGAAASRRQERGEAGEAFPELTPLASEIAKLREASLQGKAGFLQVAEAMAEEAAKEAMQLRAQQRVKLAARRTEQLEAEAERQRLKAEREEALRAQEEAAKARAEREAREQRAREEQTKEEWEAARAMQAVEAAVEARKRQEAEEEAVQRRIEQRRLDALEEERKAAEALRDAEAAAEAKKEKERERRKRQKERQQAKKKEEREGEEKKQREAEAKQALELAKANAASKCSFCASGILPGTGFERLGHTYCSTDCVKKHKAKLGS